MASSANGETFNYYLKSEVPEMVALTRNNEKRAYTQNTDLLLNKNLKPVATLKNGFADHNGNPNDAIDAQIFLQEVSKMGFLSQQFTQEFGSSGNLSNSLCKSNNPVGCNAGQISAQPNQCGKRNLYPVNKIVSSESFPFVTKIKQESCWDPSYGISYQSFDCATNCVTSPNKTASSSRNDFFDGTALKNGEAVNHNSSHYSLPSFINGRDSEITGAHKNNRIINTKSENLNGWTKNLKQKKTKGNCHLSSGALVNERSGCNAISVANNKTLKTQALPFQASDTVALKQKLFNGHLPSYGNSSENLAPVINNGHNKNMVPKMYANSVSANLSASKIVNWTKPCEHGTRQDHQNFSQFSAGLENCEKYPVQVNGFNHAAVKSTNVIENVHSHVLDISASMKQQTHANALLLESGWNKDSSGVAGNLLKGSYGTNSSSALEDFEIANWKKQFKEKEVESQSLLNLDTSEIQKMYTNLTRNLDIKPVKCKNSETHSHLSNMSSTKICGSDTLFRATSVGIIKSYNDNTGDPYSSHVKTEPNYPVVAHDAKQLNGHETTEHHCHYQMPETQNFASRSKIDISNNVRNLPVTKQEKRKRKRPVNKTKNCPHISQIHTCFDTHRNHSAGYDSYVKLKHSETKYQHNMKQQQLVPSCAEHMTYSHLMNVDMANYKIANQNGIQQGTESLKHMHLMSDTHFSLPLNSTVNNETNHMNSHTSYVNEQSDSHEETSNSSEISGTQQTSVNIITDTYNLLLNIEDKSLYSLSDFSNEENEYCNGSILDNDFSISTSDSSSSNELKNGLVSMDGDLINQGDFKNCSVKTEVYEDTVNSFGIDGITSETMFTDNMADLQTLLDCKQCKSSQPVVNYINLVNSYTSKTATDHQTGHDYSSHSCNSTASMQTITNRNAFSNVLPSQMPITNARNAQDFLSKNKNFAAGLQTAANETSLRQVEPSNKHTENVQNVGVYSADSTGWFQTVPCQNGFPLNATWEKSTAQAAFNCSPMNRNSQSTFHHVSPSQTVISVNENNGITVSSLNVSGSTIVPWINASLQENFSDHDQTKNHRNFASTKSLSDEAFEVVLLGDSIACMDNASDEQVTIYEATDISTTNVLWNLEGATCNVNQKSFKCRFCDKYFKKSDRRLYHERRVHTTEKPHVCEYCQKGFPTREQLSQHSNIHTGKFKCETCNRFCYSRLILKQHERAHAGIKHKCRYCDKMFTWSQTRNAHEETHIRTAGEIEKPHACRYCGKRFRRKSYIVRHERIHTGERPHKCTYCVKCFMDKAALATHERSHTGEKPYKCKYCDKHFAAITNLSEHQRLHTGEKPYKCKYCDRVFRTISHRLQHERTHTGERREKSQQNKFMHVTQAGIHRQNKMRKKKEPLKGNEENIPSR